MRAFLIILLLSGAASQAAATAPTTVSAPAMRPLSLAKFRRLLQRFVDKTYLTAFRHLGDERDFDHAHILFDPDSAAPRAILYHTQEMAAHYPSGSGYEFIDPGARNWIQWIDEAKIENAQAYQRRAFPESAYWTWFVVRKLPIYKKAHTIVDKMLDPVLVGAATESSLQWVFTRVGCGGPASPPDAQASSFEIDLPDGQKVCLALNS